MVRFKVKELLEKHKMSRYKLRQYSDFTYERVNQFYFNTAKSIKVEEINILCEIFNCNVSDLIEFKYDK
ncbi:MAG: helix-turn-helix transcriptional regulator [Clostridia bacterium]|nr:helix-turn-helix transcriptional regulator [Clostridia bacterium]